MTLVRLLLPLVPVALLLVACGEAGAPDPAPSGPVAAEPVAARPAPPAPPTPAIIPARFLGRWDSGAAACAGSGSPLRLEVAPDHLRFHESHARVKAVRPAGPDAVAVDLAFSGEGERWEETRILRLDADGALIVEAEGRAAQRIRCADGAPAGSSGWQASASGEGSGLTRLGDGGARLLTLFCPAGSDDLVVNVPALRAIVSEERMSVGAGGTVFALVADTAGDARRGGVTGRGAFPATELAEILAKPDGIGISYGAQASGPHPPPPAGLAAGFLAGCRE